MWYSLFGLSLLMGLTWAPMSSGPKAGSSAYQALEVSMSVVAMPPSAYRSLSLDALEARLAHGGDTTYLINFWATWCGPCIAEMPAFDAFAKAHPKLSEGGAPLKLLFVSVDAPSRAERSLTAFLAGPRAPEAEVLHLNEAKPHLYIDRIHPDWSGSIPATMLRGADPSSLAFHEGEMDAERLEAWVAKHAFSP